VIRAAKRTKGNTSAESPAAPKKGVDMAEQAYQLILSNLVSNAIKYTQAGTVRIALRQGAHWAKLEVLSPM
jgi:signal transduction histidine kinase